ncbi:MAG: PLP-dependent transferase [Acidobacteria bacterium]|nr:PLP-dependent transferase [Acidobacteriota bacterium]MBI3427983.1 PLP-dependent transferase [Acidobacteriota bacterium]
MSTRRNFIQAMSSLPLIGGLFSAHTLTAVAKAPARDYLKELGVRPFINAAGTYTALTASLMHPETMEAINYASKHFVALNDLHDAVGKRIATLVHSEAAMVTSGAASALTLATAAVLTGKSPERARQLPDLTGMKSEVLIQKTHRVGYDHAIRNCGIRLIEVETAAELDSAINDKTALLFFLNDADPKGQIKAAQFVEIAKRHNVPTLIDCAADVPPTENLWKFTKLGFDLVAFSGGKGMRGPQSSGLLLGRKDLIEAARVNAPPNGDTIGRGMKVNKEEMIGMLAALEVYLKRDADAEWKEWERRAKLIIDTAAKANPAIKGETYVPPVANHVPTVRLKWEKAAFNLIADDVRKQMRAGTPAIEITPGSSSASATTQEFSIGVWQLQPGEAEIVAKRLREVFGSVKG